jgi:hypothetical protein
MIMHTDKKVVGVNGIALHVAASIWIFKFVGSLDDATCYCTRYQPKRPLRKSWKSYPIVQMGTPIEVSKLFNRDNVD